MNVVKWMYRNIRMCLLAVRLFCRKNFCERNTLDKILDKNEMYTLIITNDNLGGTFLFLKNYIKDKKNIVICKRMSYGERPDIMYEVVNNTTGEVSLLYVNELNKVFNYKYNKIVLNSLVFVTQLDVIHGLLKDYISNNNVKLIYMLHDFHSICLKCNLFHNGKFCNLKCCDNDCRLYLGDKRIDIEEWRAKWKDFWNYVDEIRCFSVSSKNIFSSVYPDVSSKKITVKPHDISYIRYSPIDTNGWPVCIGVIGDCAPDFKGREVLLKIIKEFGDDIPIKIIGTEKRFIKARGKKVECMGKYNNSELSAIVERCKITHAVFLSLCPETFSYVVSEIIAMDIPLIGFNIGAQGEKISAYEKGVVCDSENELFEIIKEMK